MVANGASEHKSLADYASTKANGTSNEHQYPVCDQNYGQNVLGCSDEVRFDRMLHITSSFTMSPSFNVAFPLQEWRTRVDLAAAFRLCHKYGLNEGINNHLTVQ